MTDKLPYADVPWLTKKRWDEILDGGRDYGADEFCYYEGDGFDWDRLIGHFETEDEPWPEQWDHPMITKFQREVRKARREANG